MIRITRLFYFTTLLIFLGNSRAFAKEFRAGDVILLPLQCYSCEMIEDETGSIYSHSGLLIFDDRGKLMVAESLKDVHLVTIESFLKRTQKGQNPLLLRLKELETLYNMEYRQYLVFKKELTNSFYDDYLGLSFDSEFLWDNFDDDGREKLYCSEFISKILSKHIQTKIPLEPMSFKKHLDFWKKYFNGKVPEGRLGNSPATFERSPIFKKIPIILSRRSERE